MKPKNKKLENNRVFSFNDKKTIFLRGEYPEFKICKTSGDINIVGQNVGNIDMVKVIDLTTNQTAYFQGAEELN
jgi:hypothetical protein